MKAEFSSISNLIHIYPDSEAEKVALKDFWNNGLRLNSSRHKNGECLSFSIMAVKNDEKVVVIKKEG